jgi:hypothetical protein
MSSKYKSRQFYCKHDTNTQKTKSNKLIKILDKRNALYNNIWYNNNDKLNHLDRCSNKLFEKKKINTLAVSDIYLISEYYRPMLYKFILCGYFPVITRERFICNVCNTYNGTAEYIMCNIGTQYIVLCTSCLMEVDLVYNTIKSSIITKIMYINYIMKRLSLYDLYPDIVVDYFIVTLQKNKKSVLTIF